MASSRAQTPTDLIEFEEEVRRYRDGSASRSSTDAGSPHSKTTQPSDALRAAARVAR
jgi:hypothetical protein